MRKIIPALLLFLPFLLAGNVAEKAFFKVVLPAEPSAIEKEAGKELTSYLKRLYTRNIVFQGKEVPLLTFYVGKKAFPGEKEPGNYPEFYLRAGKDHIILAGHDDPGLAPWATKGETGTLLAVYYFLRKYGGLTVFAPGEKGEKLTLNTPIKMEKLVIPTPSYKARYIATASKSKEIPYIDRLKFYKKMLCRIPRFASADFYYFTLRKWDKRFKDRPELFAVHEGKRINAIYPRHLPCFANEEVFKIIVEDIQKELARKKNIKGIRLFCDGPVKICECKECSKEKDISNYFYKNVVKIANLVHKTRPDIYFHTQEKMGYYYHPPEGVKLAGNMVVEISSSFPSGKDYTANLPLFKAWKEAGAIPMIRFYPRVVFQWKDYPIIIPRAIIKHYKFMQPYAVGTKYEDGYNVPYYQGALLHYLQAQVMFDHTLDGEKTIKEFLSLAYPGGEKEMMEYFTLMEKNYFSHPAWMNPLHGALQYKYLLSAEAILEKALAKCRDPYYLRPLYEDLKRVRILAEGSRERMDHHNLFMEKFHKEMAGKFPLSIPYDLTGKKKVKWLLRPNDPVVPPYLPGSVLVTRDDKNIHFQLEAEEEDVKTMMQGKDFGKFNTFRIIIAPPDGKQFPAIWLSTKFSGEIRLQKYTASGVNHSLPIEGITLAVKKVPENKKWELKVNFPLSLLKDVLIKGRGRIGLNRSRWAADGEAQHSGLNHGISHNYTTFLPVTLEKMK